MRRTAALIIGGGPAGSAAAIMLARGGVPTELIERSRSAHDVVCGGFLGWDSLAALHRMGVDPINLGGRHIRRLRLVDGTDQVEVDLPYPAAGLSRRTLDEALLTAAASAGATITRGRSVRALVPGTTTVRLDNDDEIAGDAVFLATGKHELRDVGRPIRLTTSGAIGLRTQLSRGSATEGLSGIIELHLFNGGYAGLLLQEDGSANLCLSVSKRRFSKVRSPRLLMGELAKEAPLLSARIHGQAIGPWNAIAGVPYGWRARATSFGLFRLGDQGAVISSLVGDGVAIALTSGIEAAAAFVVNGPAGANAYQKAFTSRARSPLQIADLLRFAVERSSTRRALMRAATIRGIASLAAGLTRIS